VVTAPILWLQFDRVPLYSVPANGLAAPVMGPLFGSALTAAVLAPVLPGASAALGLFAGWLAAYLAFCARLVAALPFAQVSSLRGLAGVGGVLLAAAYAWRRWRR
jgi:competence protein ComEC